MATDEQLTRRKENAKAREEARDARIERDTETLLNTTPTPVTAVDGLGVERIITTNTSYEPPQVEPDPKEVERLANLQKRLDNQKQERLAQMTAAPQVSAKQTPDAADNTPAGEPARTEADPAKTDAELEAEKAEADAKAKAEAKKGNG